MLGLWKSEDGKVVITIIRVEPGLEEHKKVYYEIVKGLSKSDSRTIITAFSMVSVMPKRKVGFYLSPRQLRMDKLVRKAMIHYHYHYPYHFKKSIEGYAKQDVELTLKLFEDVKSHPHYDRLIV